MFNNPFDSFHDTVAEAKEEREQLDRLLTISTPRERLLVVGIAFLLCILAAWLFLGSVARNVTLDGALVEPGGKGSIQALAWVDGDIARRIEAGMPAVIELANGETNALEGVVETFVPVPVSEGLAAFQSAAPVSAHRVDIAVDEGLDFPYPKGGKCRIVIELGRQSPITLFEMRRP